MNNKIYYQVKNQPDLQEVATYLKVPLIKLDKIEGKLKTLLNNKKESITYIELLEKVTKLKDKHLLKLINNYCKLDLEYRNTTIIKEDKNNNEIIKYTSKDILLQNLSKLIEEINILEHNFNINYNESAIKSVEITNNSVYEIEKENNIQINTKKASNSVPIDKKVFTKEESKESWLDIIKSLGNCGNLLEIYLVLAFIILSTLGICVIYSKVNTQNNMQEFIQLIDDFSLEASKLAIKENNIMNYKNINNKMLIEKGIKKEYYEDGYYKNPFGENINISSTTINKPNDSIAISSAGLEPLQCATLTFKLQETHPKLVKINDKTIIKDGFIAQDEVLFSCNKDSNTITIVK